MKNIHILPTDKPSRLFIIDKSKMFLSEPPYLSFSTIGGKINKVEGSELYQPQCLCVTSDEEIKLGDWYFNNTGSAIEKLNNRLPSGGYFCKKIILTTDQDLIKDGVQAIDDEFLEWFVKNPSCEVVKIEDFPTIEKYNSKGEYIHNSNWIYKIIIPQEQYYNETFKSE
jgi:hypothetical protein